MRNSFRLNATLGSLVKQRNGTLVFTVAIGCVVVWLMKGPGYVADAYPPPGRE